MLPGFLIVARLIETVDCEAENICSIGDVDGEEFATTEQLPRRWSQSREDKHSSSPTSIFRGDTAIW